MTGSAGNALPEQALEWIAAVCPRSAMVAVHPLAGSAQSVHHIAFAGGSGAVLRRWTRPGWEADDPEYTASHEAASLILLDELGYPAPRLLGVDPTGSGCGHPAVLQTFVPGGPAPLRSGAPCAEELGMLAGRLHLVTRPHRGRIGLAYRRYYDPAHVELPAWAPDRSLWSECLAAAASPPPRTGGCGIHRDYHHGNTIWSEGRLSAVVDWDRLSWGPAGVDIAHASLNLVMAGHDGLLPSLLAGYERENGPPADLAYWTVADLADAIPDLRPEPDQVAALQRYLRESLNRLEAGRP